jgi:hypothetical protein
MMAILLDLDAAAAAGAPAGMSAAVRARSLTRRV